MRITRDTLLNQARENAKQLTAKDRGIICVYISGSLLMEDPFIGGVTDIDLICVHDRPFKARREVLRLSPEISLDLAHYEQEEFEPARRLRTDAWIGGWLENVPLVLHDPLRWYDFTRASATAQFWKVEHIAARVRSFLTPARKAWADLQEDAIPQGIKRTAAYLGALRDLANAAACFSGAPIAERRLVHDLPARAAAAGMHDLPADFVQLFTSSEFNDETFAAWADVYHQLFEALKEAPAAPASMPLFRRAYYEKAVRALYPTNPAGALWLLLYTWTRAASALPRAEQPFKDWQAASKLLELDSKGIAGRLGALDHLLDTVEEAADRLTA
jgi:hypothetical protein